MELVKIKEALTKLLEKCNKEGERGLECPESLTSADRSAMLGKDTRQS